MKLNGTEYFRKTISSTDPLDPEVLYLGGQQRLRPVRQAPDVVSKSEPITSSGTDASTSLMNLINFKGIIQDVQVKCFILH